MQDIKIISNASNIAVLHDHRDDVKIVSSSETYALVEVNRGVPGTPGAPGPGVASGGMTGQVLVKKTDDNFDTEWITINIDGVDAETLDGQDGTYYLDYNNFTNTPTIGDGVLYVSGTSGLSGEGTFSANQIGNTEITIAHDTYTYSSLSDNASTTLSNIDFLSSLTVSNGHVIGGTKRKLLAGENITISPVNNGDVQISSVDRYVTSGSISVGVTNSTMTLVKSDSEVIIDVTELYIPLIPFTKNFRLTTDWQDVGINGTDLPTGTYIMQLFANDVAAGGTNNNEYYSGIMSWYNGETDSSLELPTDEIVLHRAGGSGDAGLYLRTFRSEIGSTDRLKLQIYSNTENTSSANYVFKFRKFI